MACVMVNFGKSINNTCLVLPNTSTQPSGHLFEVFAYDVTAHHNTDAQCVASV